jgi:large subunit ribosomal protein L15
MKASRAEVRLSELNGIDAAIIDLDVLKKAGVIPVFAVRAKVVLSGELKKAVALRGIGATKGAAEAIAKAGGSIEAVVEEAPVKKLVKKSEK